MALAFPPARPFDGPTLSGFIDRDAEDAVARDLLRAEFPAFAAFDPHQASEAVESGQDQSLAVGGKLGAQQIALSLLPALSTAPR